MSRTPMSDRTARRLRACHIAAVVLIGLALAATVIGRLDLAIVALCLALFACIFASEAMRVLILYIRELRR